MNYSYIIARETCSDRNVLLHQQSIMTIKIEHISFINNMWNNYQKTSHKLPSLDPRLLSHAETRRQCVPGSLSACERSLGSRLQSTLRHVCNSIYCNWVNLKWIKLTIPCTRWLLYWYKIIIIHTVLCSLYMES